MDEKNKSGKIIKIEINYNFCIIEQFTQILLLLTVALMLHPLGFLRFPLKMSRYKLMLLLFMASSKVMVIIIGTFFGGKSPGTLVPSSEQKQSGRTQTAGSQCGALLGSVSISRIHWKKFTLFFH